MNALLTASCLLISLTISQAVEPVVHRIAADGRHQSAGRPVTIPIILAIGGKPLSIEWTDELTASPATVVVDRITDTRRATIAKGDATAVANEWTWKWTPPVTRSVVQYEIRTAAKPKPIAKIEVRDPQRLKDTSSRLSQMKWEASGLTTEEMAALSAIGLRGIAQGTKGSESYLRLISSEPGAARRQITWDPEHPDLVVWRPGPAAGDLEIRAPRWWISPKELAADHGLIRFLDLFSEPPFNP